MRHHWNPSQIAILRRGFILTLALSLFVAVFKPVKVNAQEGVECRVSYVNFTTDRETSEDGSLLHNSNQWVIIDFNLNGYYNGTIDYTVSLTTSALIPEVTCVGAYYEVTTTRSAVSSGTIYTQTDEYTFTLTNCQHFQLIYHASTSGAGVYMGGNHSLIDSDLTAVNGSSSGSAVVDYTTILNGIALDLTNIYQYMDQIAQDSANIVTILGNILTGVDDLETLVQNLYDERLEFDILNTLPYYSRLAFWYFYRIGFRVDRNTYLSQYTGWSLAPPSSYSTGTTIALQNDREYLLVYGSDTNLNQTIKFHINNGSNTFSTTSVNANNLRLMTVKYCKFTPSFRGFAYIESWSNMTNIYPIYFGTYESMPEEVAVMINEPSNNNLLKRIVDLFTQNNQQNDEMIGKLDTITDNQETINQSITDFNDDFNDAMADIPIGETTSQLQQMQSTFTYTNDLISQLWNALGRIQLVIIVALIIALIQIFRGKKT